MRPAAIHIAGGRPRSVEEFLSRSRSAPRQAAPQPKPRAGFLSASGREIKRPAIQGFACLYNTVFQASGRIRIITGPFAFIETINESTPKQLLFDHDPRRQMGDTKSGLEFANCLTGLAFRMPLDGNTNATAIFDAVMSNERACVSVGMKMSEYETRKTDCGTEYDVCSKASLTEISLVPEGAVPRTYAKVVDLDDEPEMLWTACRSPSFATDQAVANVTARGQRIVDALARLKA
ncbi:Hypothetical protein NGAL_HAMBI2605_09550 [Neorhizobium galegae bv. orientalis]|nr:Hypothetical protein NGAL_HAMBI2605_09550 [Neorhizobium galegae bv. orientalis]